MHQFIDRKTREVVTENLFKDKIVNYIYSDIREKSDILFRLLVSKRISSLIAFIAYDLPGTGGYINAVQFAKKNNIRIDDCVDIKSLTSPRKFFERKIRYWESRPMPDDRAAIVSPADSRMIAGSLSDTSSFFLKDKFFSFNELLGYHRSDIADFFTGGNFAVFRLTPEKYHWNHFPVSGIIEEFYEIDGSCHSCNPGAVIAVATPFSKNRRTVTLIDTDVPDGSMAGMVIMCEVAALMIGGISQCYSDHKYENPQPLKKGLFVKKGNPKSVYRPGSSVDILIFQKGRVSLSPDIIANLVRRDAVSRLSNGFASPLVETEVVVRSEIGRTL